MQNKVQQSVSRLPQQVQQQGLTVTKSNPDFLIDRGDLRHLQQDVTNEDVSDYLVSKMQEHDRPA